MIHFIDDVSFQDGVQPVDGKYHFNFVDYDLASNDLERYSRFIKKIEILKCYFEDSADAGGFEEEVPDIDKNNIVINVLCKSEPTPEMLSFKELRLETGELISVNQLLLDESTLSKEDIDMIRRRVEKSGISFGYHHDYRSAFNYSSYYF